MEIPNLEWGSNSKRKLGSYDYHTDTISISTIFLDSEQELLDYLIYHEMLHKKLKFNSKNNRSYHHTKKFKAKEKELITFKSTLKAELNSYQVYNDVSKDTNVLLSTLTDTNLKFFNKDIDMDTSYIYYKIMGDYFDPLDINADINVCFRTNEITEDVNGNGKFDEDEIVVSCTDQPSEEEHYCYYLEDSDNNLILDSKTYDPNIKDDDGEIIGDEYCQ
jgi:hypothetical protein